MTSKLFLVKTMAGMPTEDFTFVALILAAQRSSQQQIMESGSGGRGGGWVMDVESSDAL